MSTPTDEEVAELAQTVWENGQRNLDPNYDPWLDFARALRAALEPPVPPLAPGETVTIPDTDTPSSAALELRDAHGVIHATVCQDHHRIRRAINLDAAGVAQLIEVARRWQAAQGEGQ